MKIDADEIRRRFKIANDLFRKEFKEQRRRLHMNQTEIAHVFGVCSPTISSWERGNRVPFCGMSIALEVMREMEPRENGNNFGAGTWARQALKYTKEENEKFVEMFRQERLRLQITMDKLGSIFGVSDSTIHYWESGACQPSMAWEAILHVMKNKITNPPDSP